MHAITGRWVPGGEAAVSTINTTIKDLLRDFCKPARTTAGSTGPLGLMPQARCSRRASLLKEAAVFFNVFQ